MKEEKQPKVVNMKGSADNKSNGQQKLTYEQLNDACMQLSQQNQYLSRQLQQANLTNMFKRLDYLFMVLNYESVIKDPDFVNSCVEEIKNAIRVEKEGDEEEPS